MNNPRNILFVIACGIGFFACKSETNMGSDTDSTNIIETDTVAIPDSVFLQPPVVMFKEEEVRATGNEPFWLLELKNDSVHFKLISGFEFRELLPPPTINTKDSLQYKFQTGPAIVAVLFLNKECVDGMSGFKSPFTVNMTFTGPDNTQLYNGCGDYLSAFDKVREPENP